MSQIACKITKNTMVFFKCHDCRKSVPWYVSWCLFILILYFISVKNPSQFKVMLKGFSYILFYVACQLLHKLKGNLVHHKSFLCCHLKASTCLNPMSQKLLVWEKWKSAFLPQITNVSGTTDNTYQNNFYPLKPLYLQEAMRGGIQSLHSIVRSIQRLFHVNSLPTFL